MLSCVFSLTTVVCELVILSSLNGSSPRAGTLLVLSTAVPPVFRIEVPIPGIYQAPNKYLLRALTLLGIIDLITGLPGGSHTEEAQRVAW